MRTRSYTSLLLLLLAAVPVTAGPRHDKLLLSLYEDSAGSLLKTREITIYESGKVLEETYNFHSGNPRELHHKHRLKSLSRSEIDRIRSLLSKNDFQSMPASVEAENGIIPDAPFRMIRSYMDGTEHKVQWNNYNENPRTQQGLQFMAAWREVSALIGWRG